ncbi:MAG: hypothetical protein QNJ45_03905 [Ardenticatenaceae bacterium]|nr:hypothetical protein [Ardenticatenaceae bacterium]
MAYKEHVIKEYSYSFAAGSGPDRIQLWGESGLVGDIRFVNDHTDVPPPVIWAGLTGAEAYFNSRDLPALVDLLRNESPVKITLNDQPPGFVFVHSGSEPAGEEESTINNPHIATKQLSHVDDFGASVEGDASANAIGIQAAINSVGDNGGGTVVFSPGTYEIDNSIIVNQPASIILQFQNTKLRYVGEGCQTALTFSAPTDSTPYKLLRGTQGVLFLENGPDRSAEKVKNGWKNNITGIRVENVVQSSFDTLHVRFFTTGIELSAPGTFHQPTAYNRFIIGSMKGNQVGLRLQAGEGGAWANDNTFIGGTWANGANIEGACGSRNVVIENGGHNRFIACSFEGDTERNLEMAETAGNNVFTDCRFENPPEHQNTKYLVYSAAKSAVFTGCVFVTRSMGKECGKWDTPMYTFHTLANAGPHILIGCKGPEFVQSETDVAPIYSIGSQGSNASPPLIGNQLITNSAFTYFDGDHPIGWQLSGADNYSICQVNDPDDNNAPLHGSCVLKIKNLPEENDTDSQASLKKEKEVLISQKLTTIPGSVYTFYVRYRVSGGIGSIELDKGEFVGNKATSIIIDEDDKWHVSCRSFIATQDETNFGFKCPEGETTFLDMMAVNAGLEVPQIYTPRPVDELGGMIFGNLELADAEAGVILRSENNSRFRITVSDSGELKTIPIETSLTGISNLDSRLRRAQ